MLKKNAALCHLWRYLKNIEGYYLKVIKHQKTKRHPFQIGKTNATKIIIKLFLCFATALFFSVMVMELHGLVFSWAYAKYVAQVPLSELSEDYGFGLSGMLWGSVVFMISLPISFFFAWRYLFNKKPAPPE